MKHALRNVPAASVELTRYLSESKSISLVTWIEVMAGATAENESETREFLEEFVVLRHGGDRGTQRRDSPG